MHLYEKCACTRNTPIREIRLYEKCTYTRNALVREMHLYNKCARYDKYACSTITAKHVWLVEGESTSWPNKVDLNPAWLRIELIRSIFYSSFVR